MKWYDAVSAMTTGKVVTTHQTAAHYFIYKERTFMFFPSEEREPSVFITNDFPTWINRPWIVAYNYRPDIALSKADKILEVK